MVFGWQRERADTRLDKGDEDVEDVQDEHHPTRTVPPVSLHIYRFEQAALGITHSE